MSESARRPVLYLPVEVKVRELRGKAFLALHAAAAGFDVFMGNAGPVQILALEGPSGVFIDKNINPRRKRLFEALRGRGHAVAAWDEEAIAVLDLDWYVQKNIKPEMLTEVNRFFAWGEAERDAILARFPQFADRIIVTGNPRADVLRPENLETFAMEGRAHRETYGAYILFISNFSRVNLFAGTRDEFVGTLVKSFALSPEQTSFLRGSLDFSEDMFAHFRALIPRIAADFPDHNLIIRPHPAESHEVWHDVARNLPNVQVATSGDAVGWISAAGAVLHNGCTTAIEAFLMGRLAVAYRPIASDRFDVKLPNELSLATTTYEELVEVLRAELTDARAADRSRQEWRDRAATAAHAIGSLNGSLASTKIVQEALKLIPQTGPEGTWNRAAFIARASRDFLQTRVVEAVQRVRASLRLQKNDPARRRRQKFPGMSLSELQQLQRQFAVQESQLAAVRIEALGFDTFRLSGSGVES